MNTTNTKQIHQLAEAIIALKEMLETVNEGLLEIRDALAPIASEELANAPRKPETAPGPWEYLVTEKDYRNAPEGTVVAEDGELAYQAWDNGKWEQAGHFPCEAEDMAGKARGVLRWGWEA